MAKNSFKRSERFAIGNLVSNRCRELGLGRADLIRRTSYKNLAKGLRRLDELFAGELERTKDLIRALPYALRDEANLRPKAFPCHPPGIFAPPGRMGPKDAVFRSASILLAACELLGTVAMERWARW
jgi:hypothetical protein